MTKIKFNIAMPIFTFTMALSAGFLFYFGAQKGMEVDPSMKWIVPMVGLMSLPMFFVSYIVVTDREIVVNNQWGMVRRRYSFNNKNEISMTGNRIFLNKPNKKEEVKFSRFLADKKGLRQLEAQLIESQINNI